MIGDSVVIDGVVHGYHSPPETYTHPISELVVESLYQGYHKAVSYTHLTLPTICSV